MQSLQRDQETLKLVEPELRQREQECQRAHEELTVARAALESERQALEEEMKKHWQRQAAQEEARSAKVAELEADLAAARIEIESLKAVLDEREGAVNHQPEELRAAREQLETKRVESNDLQSRLSQQQDVIAESQMQLDEQVAELERQRAQFRREQEEFFRYEHQRAADRELASAPVQSSMEAPPQLEAQFSGEGESPPKSQPSEGAARPEPSVEDDESVEDYVARMMDRMGVSRPQAPPSVAAPSAASRGEHRVEEHASSPQIITPVVDISTAEEYIPRSQAPEKGTDLAAMRALANDAADEALRAHARRRSDLLAARASVVAVVSLVGSAAIAAAWHVTRSPIAFYGASFFGVLGALCSINTLWHRCRSLFPGRGRKR